MASETQAAEVESLLHEVATLNKSVQGQEDRQHLMLAEMKLQLDTQLAQMSPSAEIAELKQMLTSRSGSDDPGRLQQLEHEAIRAEGAIQLMQQEAARQAAEVARLSEELHGCQPKLVDVEQQVSDVCGVVLTL